MKKLLKYLNRIFDKKYKIYNCYYNEIREIFSKDKFSLYAGSAYPEKFDMSEAKIYAYLVKILVTEDSYKNFIAILKRHFSTNFDNIKNKPIVQEGIAFAIIHEFKGLTINLITNNIQLLNDIDSAKLDTRPPWIVFPELDPRYLGSLQGDMDYWFCYIWDPFWNNLSLEERKSYFSKTKPNRYWANILLESPLFKIKEKRN